MHISSCKPVYVCTIGSRVNPNFIEHVHCVSSAVSLGCRWLRDEIIKWHEHAPVRWVSGLAGGLLRYSWAGEWRCESLVNSISSYICEEEGKYNRPHSDDKEGADNGRSSIISTPLWQCSNLMRHTVSAWVSLCLTLSGGRSICKHKGTQRKQQHNKARPCKAKMRKSDYKPPTEQTRKAALAAQYPHN